SLARTGLAAGPNAVRLSTIDISPRVLAHMTAARQGAERGLPYIVQLALDASVDWDPALVAYWRTAGTMVGTELRSTAASPSARHSAPVRGMAARPVVGRQSVPPATNA